MVRIGKDGRIIREPERRKREAAEQRWREQEEATEKRKAIVKKTFRIVLGIVGGIVGLFLGVPFLGVPLGLFFGNAGFVVAGLIGLIFGVGAGIGILDAHDE